MYLRLRVELKLKDGGAGEALTAPRLRRVLGKAFVDGWCPFGRPRCQDDAKRTAEELCPQAGSCPYGVLYAASRSGRPPFALYVPSSGESVELTLFGPAWRLYGWVLLALEGALAAGLGKRREQWEIARVVRVRPERDGEELCGDELEDLPSDVEPDVFSLTTDRYLVPRPVGVELLSPTRFVRDGRLVHEGAVPFEVLVGRVLDRFRGLYGDGASEILRPSVRTAIEARASAVGLVEDETRWVEVKDYSARSRSELLLGGKMGRMVYGEGASSYLPILEAGEILHVGKNPASGCGRMRVIFDN
jgi:hypothetical protein